MTRGGDLGGESAIIDVGLDLGLLRGVRRVLIPGVSGPGPLKSDRCGDDVRGPLSRGMSREVRLSSRDLWSSGLSNLSYAVGDVCIGEVAEVAEVAEVVEVVEVVEVIGGGLFTFNIFSK